MRRSPLNPSRSLSKLVPERAGGIAGGIAGGYGAFIPHLLRIRGGIWGFLGHDPGSIAGVKWLGKILGKKLCHMDFLLERIISLRLLILA